MGATTKQRISASYDALKLADGLTPEEVSAIETRKQHKLKAVDEAQAAAKKQAEAQIQQEIALGNKKFIEVHGKKVATPATPAPPVAVAPQKPAPATSAKAH